MSAIKLPQTKAFALAHHASELSQSLQLLQEKSDHGNVVAGFSKITTELGLISMTLFQLCDTIPACAWQYTLTLDRDIAEIAGELLAVFHEIAKCCEQMQNNPASLEQYDTMILMEMHLAKLQKHIEAAGPTLSIMLAVFDISKKPDPSIPTATKATASSSITSESENEIERLCNESRQAIMSLRESEEMLARSVTDQEAIPGPDVSVQICLYRLILKMDIWGASEHFRKRWFEGYSFAHPTRGGNPALRRSNTMGDDELLHRSISDDLNPARNRPSNNLLLEVQPVKETSNQRKGSKGLALLRSSIRKGFKTVFEKLSTSTKPAKKSDVNNELPRKSWRRRMSTALKNSPLRDSDFDQEFENGNTI